MCHLTLLALVVACSGDAIPTSPEGPEQNRLVATVEVEPPYLEIGPDDLGFLDAVVKSARGRVVNGRAVQWRSSDPSVVSIEPDGRVTGVNEGEAEIYAQVEGRRGSAVIKVRGTVIGIEMPEQILASEGATKQVEAIFRYRNGAVRPAGRVKWSSENPTIVTIDGDGLLRARTTGTTKIVAFARGHSRESGVKVNASAVASLELSTSSLELEPGDTEQLWAEVLDANGNRLDKKVVWSSYDASVATVDGDGLVTAVAVGSTTIEAKSGGETATAEVQVVESSSDNGSTTTSSAAGTPSQVRDLRVTAADDHSVTLAFTQVDDGTGSPADYVVRYGLPSISWSSASDVTKGSCAGSVSGTSIGGSLSCTVDALQASTDYEFLVVAYRGTLGSDAVFGPPSNVAAGTTDDPPVFVDVSPSYMEMDEGQTGQLDAEVTDAYGNPVSGYSVTWNSSNTTVASVDQDGMVSAQTAGDATVQASVDGDTDGASVAVNQTTTSSTDDGGSTGSSTRSAELRYSLSATRSSPAKLSGATLSDAVYIYLATDSVGVDSVVFKVDGVREANQEVWPYDFAGGPANDPNPWDTNEVADGGHRIEATVFGDPGGTFAADFTVDNSASSSSIDDTGSGSDGDSGGPISAFPGAEGYGATALSECRSLPLRVWAVTNTNDSGSGSLRDIVENKASSSTFDVVVFRTGGTIELSDRIRRDRLSCLYIAGQTAPGGGIQLTAAPSAKNSPIQILSAGADSDHWVIRYVRLRGDNSDGTGAQGSNFASGGLRYAVLDHVSTCCSDDKEMSIDQSPELGGQTLGYITISNSIVYAPRGTGINVHADPDENHGDAVSVIRSYMGGKGWRFPRFAEIRNVQVVENLIYGWESDGVRLASDNGAYRMNIEWLRNRHSPIPGTTNKRFGSAEYADHNPDKQGSPNFYAVGNIHDQIAPSPSDDQTQWFWRQDRNYELPDSTFKSSPTLSHRPDRDVTFKWSAAELGTKLVAEVGASRRLACDGSWLAARDDLDRSFLGEFQNRTWIGTGVAADYGGLPQLSSGSPCTDSDGDGMPDAWESNRGLNPNDSADAGRDADGDGYLNIEEYLNGSTP